MNEICGLLIDYEYCTGCHSCEVACREEHSFGIGTFGIKVMEDGPRLDELSLRLKETIGISIRHSDTFTRYGKGQYLILLTNTSREDCEVVRKRIDRNFLSPGQRTGVEYQINTAIICPDEILL